MVLIDNLALDFDILGLFSLFLEEQQLSEVMFFLEVKEAFEGQLLSQTFFLQSQELVIRLFNFFEVVFRLIIQPSTVSFLCTIFYLLGLLQ
jgi:hypothetical protein